MAHMPVGDVTAVTRDSAPLLLLLLLLICDV